MNEGMMQTLRDHARGCLLGALIGDAAGATLEFIGRRPNDEDLDRALAMTGGGAHRVAPGQITDDGELTLALARALLGQPHYPRGAVARNYRLWCLSPPFDIGNATGNALGRGAPDDIALADRLATNAQANSESKANGALMRITPVGIWSVGVSDADAIAAAMADAQLTHPNVSCQWANAAYVIAIRHLLRQPGDHQGAVQAAGAVLLRHRHEGAAEVQSWFDEAVAGTLPACHPEAGYVRIAFTHALYHLDRATPYQKALRAVLSGGGDTDTNACIVGGLIGALWGAHSIPAAMIQAVVQCDTSRGRARPDWLRPRDATALADGLALRAPQD